MADQLLSEIGVKTSVLSPLRRIGIETVDQAKAKTAKQLRSETYGFGPASLDHLRTKLREQGQYLKDEEPSAKSNTGSKGQ